MKSISITVIVCLILAVIGIQTSSAEDESKPCNSLPPNGRIDYGDVITCSISLALETDEYEFFGREGETVVILASVRSGGLKPCIELIAPDNTRFDACGPTFTNEIDEELPITGTYSILVEDWLTPDTGEYTLALERVIPPSSSARPIKYDDNIENEINPHGDIDLFFFEGTVGDNIKAKVWSRSGNLIPCIELIAPDNTRFGACGVSSINEIDEELPITGAYSILIDDWFKPDTGEYTLDLVLYNEDDNSKFYGTFDYTATGTQPNGCTDSDTTTIGSDINQLNGSCDYIYIPSSGTSASYSFVDCDGYDIDRTITISGNIIHLEETGECPGVPSPCWTTDVIITFDDDYNGGTITAEYYDVDSFECQGTMAGSFTRVGYSTEIIGTWSNGIWYWDVAASKWTKMTSSTPTGDIAAGDFTGDGIADVASIWPNGLFYQDGATLDWKKVGTAPNRVTAGDVTGDGRSEIIGTWSDGVWYRDVAESSWTQMTSSVTNGDIAAGDFTGDGIADVASSWPNGLFYQDGATLDWKKVGTAPNRVTAGDVTGDGRSEIIGTWSDGVWYRDVAESSWTQMTSSVTDGDIAAGDFTGDGIADVASSWPNGLFYQDGATLDWKKVGTAPNMVTAGDVTGD